MNTKATKLLETNEKQILKSGFQLSRLLERIKQYFYVSGLTQNLGTLLKHFALVAIVLKNAFRFFVQVYSLTKLQKEIRS